MRYIVGLVFFAGAAAFFWTAYARRRRVIAAGPDAAPPLHASLQMLGDTMPPLIVLALCIIGAKMTLAYVVSDAGRYFSVFDLAGFLALLAGYGTSVVFRARYREAVRERRDQPAEAQPRPGTTAVAPSR